MEMSDERIAEIRERCDKAMPGPWYLGIESADSAPMLTVYTWKNHREGPYRFLVTYAEYDARPSPEALQRNSDNYAFIAAARQNVPDLLAEVERLRAENDELRRIANTPQFSITELDGHLELGVDPDARERGLVEDLQLARARNAELEDTAIRLHGAVILAASLEDTVKQLRARNAELVEVLRSVEWVERVNGVGRLYGHCPSCQRDEPRHAPDCALDAELHPKGQASDGGCYAVGTE